MGLTSMTLQDLDNFPRLEVPEVYLRVLAAAHDMFPARREIREDTVRAIGVARVGLNAARYVGIPQANCRVLRAREDELGIRSEFDV